MRILLANMPITFGKKENLEPPLGISYLGAVLKDCGHDVILKDYEVEDFSQEELLAFIKKNIIELVGISFRTASYRSAKIFANTLRRLEKPVIIVSGGHHATAFPEEVIKDLPCDIVVRSEGEDTIKELVSILESKKHLSSVKGITYAQGKNIVRNDERPAILNLDTLPFPARKMLPYERYSVATILTSRGCPFSCIYCDKGVSTRKVKFRSPESVYKEIREVTNQFPGKRIYFVDDHFFLFKSRLNKIFDFIESDNHKFNWVCQARVDGVDYEMLNRAKQAGCDLIMYGIESGDQDELDYMRKQTTPEDARKALIWTKQAGIRARANFMLGFPISTHRTIRNTIKFAKNVPLEVVRFFSVAPLPNTELWERVYGNSIDISKIEWDKFDFYTPVYSTPELSSDDILSYVGAGYIHVLKNKVAIELLTFLPRFIRLLYKSFKSGKVRGNISIVFPSMVNFFIDLNNVVHLKRLGKKINFMIRAIYLEAKISRDRKA